MDELELCQDVTRAAAMEETLRRLFPICRSLTGDGVRESLGILGDLAPIQTFEVASGTQVFDWTVPDEWTVGEAYIADSSGCRIVDFADNNLHLVGYSEPFEGALSLEELDKHLHSLPEQEKLIPYVTSYYERRWGFCLSHAQRKALKPGQYRVKVDTTLQSGSMTLGELVIPGGSEQEILLSTYLCHPSMANNELSGPVLATYLARELSKQKRRYTYRIIYVPETVGAIAYLARHLEHLQKHVVAGYVVTCVGMAGPLSYLETRLGNTLVDRMSSHVLERSGYQYLWYPWLARGSDERQYNWPGVDLPVGSLMRTKYGEYPEYHTSGDNLDLVSGEALEDSLQVYLTCLEALERNRTYRCTTLCEPQLGRRGLYPSLGTRDAGRTVRLYVDVLAYCDGDHDLLAVAERVDVPIWSLYPIVERLVTEGLLEEVGP